MSDGGLSSPHPYLALPPTKNGGPQEKWRSSPEKEYWAYWGPFFPGGPIFFQEAICFQMADFSPRMVDFWPKKCDWGISTPGSTGHWDNGTNSRWLRPAILMRINYPRLHCETMIIYHPHVIPSSDKKGRGKWQRQRDIRQRDREWRERERQGWISIRSEGIFEAFVAIFHFSSVCHVI